ncbi:MAG: ExbD/TolR family protein [Puniceicoccaceae bacterium]
MRLRRYRDDSTGENAEINLSPLIDVVFILLIFFIVTSVFAEREGIEINKPAASSSQPLNQEALIIQVHQNGTILHRSEELSPANLTRLVERFVAQGGASVVVEADAASASLHLVRVVDLAIRAGAPSVSLSTQKND